MDGRRVVSQGSWVVSRQCRRWPKSDEAGCDVQGSKQRSRWLVLIREPCMRHKCYIAAVFDKNTVHNKNYVQLACNNEEIRSSGPIRAEAPDGSWRGWCPPLFSAFAATEKSPQPYRSSTVTTVSLLLLAIRNNHKCHIVVSRTELVSVLTAKLHKNCDVVGEHLTTAGCPSYASASASTGIFGPVSLRHSWYEKPQVTHVHQQVRSPSAECLIHTGGYTSEAQVQDWDDGLPHKAST